MTRRLLVRALLLLPLLGLPAARAAAQGPARPAAAPLRASPADFRALRWLEGRWRGAAAGEKPFYEGYGFRDDSTLVMTYFADSTLTRTTGTATVELRGGRILHRSGPALWAVTRSDSSGVHFVPLERAGNSFVWKRESPSAWTASLSFPGRPPVLYRLTRLPG